MTTPLLPAATAAPAAVVVGASNTPALAGINPNLMQVLEYKRPVTSYAGDRLIGVDLARSITQAATLKLTFNDPKRELMRSPLLTEAVTIDTGANPPVRFQLVQVSKSGDQFTATYEDAVVAKLRKITGQLASASGVTTRAGFAKQLLAAAGVPAVIPASGLATALVPLTRGTTQTPDEDTWACLVRIASDVAYRCFSDGTSVWFGPDSWLFGLPPAMQIGEYTDAVDTIDFDYDIGKPVATAKVTTYAAAWKAGLGARVSVRNLASASGDWLVSDIGRNMYKAATSVSLVQPTPTLPEPAPTSTDTSAGTHTVTFQASN